MIFLNHSLPALKRSGEGREPTDSADWNGGNMKKSSLAARLVMGGVIAVLMPLIVIGVFTIHKATNSLTSVSKEEAAGIAHKLAQTCEVALRNELKVVKTLALERGTIEALPQLGKNQGADAAAYSEKLARYLADVMKSAGSDYESVLISNAEGLVVADGTNGEYKNISMADRDYFKVSKEGKANIGTVVKSKKTGKPIVPVAAPILGPNGQFLGTMAVLLKIDYLVEEIAGTKTGKTGYAFMTDKTGLIIAHPRKELILELNLTTLKGMERIVSEMMGKKSGVEDYVFEGIKKIAGYAPVELTGWSVALTQPEDEFLEGVYAMRNGTILVAGIFLALTIIAVLFFARRISVPIMRVVEGLNEGADQVAAASAQVSSSSQSLAEGASEQAASLEETSSSLEEMASMTKQNADHANQANALMMEIRRVVDGSNSAMRDLTTSMGEISKSSEETSKIIKTIDEIAFQTNLLALNAAVEAARAGEAGAGFAVVADEVRNLAIRAAEAAKNTASLIEGTVKRIKDGTELVTKTGNAFQLVSTSTGKMGELVGEIAAASNEQAQGIDQINKAVSEMDSVVQQNAASAEESASASEELNAQAEQMKGYVKDLVAVVGGNQNGRQRKGWNRFRSKATTETTVDTKPAPAIHPPKRTGNGKVLIRGDGHAVTAQRPKVSGSRSDPKSAQMTPSQILPLDADDFDQF